MNKADKERMDNAVSIVLVGLGGYGAVYVEALLDERQREVFRFVGAVDPAPERCLRLADLRRARVRIYASLEEFYDAAHAELAVISSPIQLHCEQTCLALQHGSNVLCEKPAAAVVQDVDRMIYARDAAGVLVGIGYQWSFSKAIQGLKRDIRSGLFGAPRRLRCMTLWPRGEQYYRRNNWAGRARDAEGRWVLDSPANNAMAHDLHNMLYVLGEEEDTSAAPRRIVAETYRANEIETFDTVAARVEMDGGATLVFVASHATRGETDPTFRFEFEQAVVEYRGGEAPVIARMKDGSMKQYGSPKDEAQWNKLYVCAKAIRGTGVIPCGLEAARAQTVCINGISESSPSAVVFPPGMVAEVGEPGRRVRWVEGLEETLSRCFEESALAGELGAPWARKGRTVTLQGYGFYPGGASP